MGLFNFLKKDKPQEPVDEFTQQMIAESTKCVDRFKDRHKGLDFTVDSLKVADNILEEVGI
ncbi:MAG: hypothetical protein ACOYXT_24115 [Bacteroidota bacterium]